MNQSWDHFLQSQNTQLSCDEEFSIQSSGTKHKIYPLTHLAVLTLAGNDTAKLLQGQITCNINDISGNKSSLGALCNPKGRVITTFLLVKTPNTFLMVLPRELLDTAKTVLRKYILRADVKIIDESDNLCLVGLAQPASKHSSTLFDTHQEDNIVISWSQSPPRSLIIAEPEQAISLWTNQVNQLGYLPASSIHWQYMDIISGVPWLSTKTSEEFIPQMLNLDKLGGISFTKGCYTGQEIIARTHYLGQAKREMFLAEANMYSAPEPNTSILDYSQETKQTVGKVIQAVSQQGLCKMLVVLQVLDSNHNLLKLDNQNQDSITLLSL